MIQNAKHDHWSAISANYGIGLLIWDIQEVEKSYIQHWNECIFPSPCGQNEKTFVQKSPIHYLSLPHATFAPKTVFAVSSRTPPINISFEEAVCIVAKCWWQISIPPAWLDIYPLSKNQRRRNRLYKNPPIRCGNPFFCALKRKGNKKNWLFANESS